MIPHFLPAAALSQGLAGARACAAALCRLCWRLRYNGMRHPRLVSTSRVVERCRCETPRTRVHVGVSQSQTLTFRTWSRRCRHKTPAVVQKTAVGVNVPHLRCVALSANAAALKTQRIADGCHGIAGKGRIHNGGRAGRRSRRLAWQRRSVFPAVRAPERSERQRGAMRWGRGCGRRRVGWRWTRESNVVVEDARRDGVE